MAWVWHGLQMSPTVRALGQGFCSLSALFPYQTEMIGLGKFHVFISKYVVKCYLSANLQTYTYNFYLLHKSQNRHWVIWILNPVLSLLIKSNLNSFAWQSKSYYHQSAFLILSPTHLTLLDHCAPQCPPNIPATFPPVCAFVNAVSELPSFPIIINTLPVFGLGGWWEGSILPAYPMHMSPGVGHYRGQGTGSAFSVSPQCWDVTCVHSQGSMLSTSEYILKLFVFMVGKKESRDKGLGLISHRGARTHLRQQS